METQEPQKQVGDFSFESYENPVTELKEENLNGELKKPDIQNAIKTRMNSVVQKYVAKYKIDLIDLIDISRIQSQVWNVISFNSTNEKLKQELWKYKSKYHISFLDYGELCNELVLNQIHKLSKLEFK